MEINMFKNSKWIRYRDAHIEGLQLRKEFFIRDDVLSATLNIIGLGYGVYYINGEEVTDDVLLTQFTNFDKRILYNKYDVTRLISKGENCVYCQGDGSLIVKGTVLLTPML